MDAVYEVEQLRMMRATLIAQCYEKVEKMFSADSIPLEVNGTVFQLDGNLESLFKLKESFSKAKESKVAYSQKMITKDYKVINLDKDAIVTKIQPVIDKLFDAYAQKADLIEQLNGMDYFQLKEWMDSSN